MPVFIVVLIIIAVVIAFATGFFSLRKTDSGASKRGAGLAAGGAPRVNFDLGGSETRSAADETTAEEEPAEIIDLVDYYADYEPDKPAAKAVEKPKDIETDDQYDRLCNVKVGRGYLQDCQRFLHSAAESGQHLAMLRYDFRRFRFINTLRGLLTGDYALTRLTQEVRDILPEGAMVTRLSADHFAALFVYIDEATMDDIFEKMRRAADRIRGDVGAKNGMQLCVGLAIATQKPDYDIFKLMRRANIARHCQKGSKSEGYSIFDESMLTSFLYGESAMDDFNEHQFDEEFEVFLRPQINVASKRITSCDSSVRWACELQADNSPPEDGALLPDSNLGVAYQAIRALSRWRKAGHIPLPVMVGVNEVDLFKEDLDEYFAQTLSEFQLDAPMVTVRISLHDVRIAPGLVARQMKKLTEMGLKVAICDIDRGITGTEDLSAVAPSYLKLHKSFMHDIERKPERRNDVTKALNLAASLGAGTIFEGVDNGACLNVVSEAGATFAQGRFVGRNSTIDVFTEDIEGFLKGGAINSSGTVVLDEIALNKGNYNV